MLSVLMVYVRWGKSLQRLLRLTSLLSRVRIWWTNCWFEFSVFCFRGYTDVSIFSNRSRQAPSCMCSTYLMSYTHVLEDTLWKHVDWNKFAGNENFRIWNLFVCCRTWRTFVRDCRRSEQRISKTKRSHFVGSELFSVDYISCSTWLIWSVLLMCVRWDKTIHKPRRFHLFVVRSGNVFETTKMLNGIFLWVTRMSVSTPNGHVRHPRACVTLIWLRTLKC